MHASQLDAGVFFPPGSDDGMTGSVRVKVIKLCNWAIKKKKSKMVLGKMLMYNTVKFSKGQYLKYVLFHTGDDTLGEA